METVDPSLTGAVELWMGEVEGVMRRTLHKLAGQALAAYAVTDRSKWILEWPGQLVLNCSQVQLWLHGLRLATHIVVKPKSRSQSLQMRLITCPIQYLPWSVSMLRQGMSPTVAFLL